MSPAADLTAVCTLKVFSTSDKAALYSISRHAPSLLTGQDILEHSELSPRLKQQTCTMIKVFFPQEVTDFAAVLPLASSGRQGSIPTAARRRQCKEEFAKLHCKFRDTELPFTSSELKEDI